MGELLKSETGVLAWVSVERPPVTRSMAMKDSLPLRIMRLCQGDLAKHNHEFDELVVTLKGRGVHCTGSEEYPIHAGDIFFIRPGVSHSYRDTDGLEIANILYYPSRLGVPLEWLKESPGYRALFELEPESRSKLSFKGRLTLSLDALSSVEMMILEMEGELSSHGNAGVFMAAAILMRLLGTLSRLYERGPSPSAAHLVRIGRTISFIETAYKRKITLDELARMSRMSKSSLIREFRRLAGTTPVDYLLRVRLGKAAELLTSGEASIGEAALRCGFADGNYFARQFKRFTGLSPREYRRLAEEGAPLPKTTLNAARTRVLSPV